MALSFADHLRMIRAGALPPPQTGPVVMQDDFTGTASQNVYLRSGWSEHGLTAQRSKFLIAANGREMQMVGGGANGYAVYKSTGTADHWAECTLGTSTLASWWIGCTLQTPYVSGGVFTDGVYINIWSTIGIQLTPRSGGVNGSTVSIAAAQCPAGTFPLWPGDIIKADWNGTTKVVRLYKNNALIYTSAGLTVATPGQVVGFASTSSGYIDAFRCADSSTPNAIEPDQIGLVVNRDAGQTSRAVPITGTYSGAAPSSIQYRVMTAAGVVSGLDWQTLSGATIGSGVWSGTTAAIPTSAADCWVEVRKGDAQAITGKSRRFSVGIVVALYGQSNATRQPSEATSSTVTPATGAYYSTTKSPTQTANRAPQELANRIASATSLPCVVVCDGLGATAITNLKPGSATWTSFEAHLASYGTQIEGFYFFQGESDSGTDKTAYQADMSSMRSRLHTITGRSNSTLRWLVCQVARSTTGGAAANWQALRDAQLQWCVDNSETLAAHAVAEAQADSLHVNGEGYFNIAQRVAHSFRQFLGQVANNGRGPIPTSAAHTNGTNTVTVSFDLNGCTSLVSNTGLTGWEVSADNWATTLTISSAATSGNTVVITLSAVANEVKVRHLYGDNPAVTNVVKGNGLGLSADIPAAPCVLTAA